MSVARKAYGIHATEYVDALGSVDKMEPLDVALIESWARGVDGEILDAGCGPGHWTDFLAYGGHQVCGIDITTEFIESARERFPTCDFEVMDFDDMSFGSGRFGGVLAWYSLIHNPSVYYPALLTKLARVIRPGGTLLLGTFLGDHGQPFEHAVARAYFTDVGEMTMLLENAGFRVEEVHTRRTPRHREHLAVVARCVAPRTRT